MALSFAQHFIGRTGGFAGPHLGGRHGRFFAGFSCRGGFAPNRAMASGQSEGTKGKKGAFAPDIDFRSAAI